MIRNIILKNADLKYHMDKHTDPEILLTLNTHNTQRAVEF